MEHFFLIITLVVNTLQSSSAKWTADIPSSISTIKDVCVVIPCTYKYPDTKPNISKTWTGSWHTMQSKEITVYDENPVNVHQDFKDRTRLIGNLSQGYCSLMINNVTETDGQKMYFRIKIKNLDSYSYINKNVLLTVQDVPLLTLNNNVRAGTVSAFCSVPYTCPSDHPKFAWNRNGTVAGTYVGSAGRGNLTSHLSFKPTISDLKEPVTCTVTSSSGKKTEASQKLTEELVWAIEVPESVRALRGSCAVIPCAFLCPDLSNPINTSAGFWFTSNDFVYHAHSSKIAGQYKNRTELVRDLRKGNCSLKIIHMQHNDTGPFYFRIEMTNFNYSFTKYKVSIDILEAPENPLLRVSEFVRVGKNVSAFCSLNHSCISDIPFLTWNHNGLVSAWSELLSTGQWSVMSVLTFIPTISDNTKNLICTAENKLQNKTNSSTLNVHYPPEIQSTSACTTFIEEVACHFCVDSNPPSEVEISISPNVSYSKNETAGSLIVLLRAASGQQLEVSCYASNEEGNATLTLYVNKKDPQIFVYACASLASAALLILLTFGFWKCRKTKKQNESTKDNAADIYENCKVQEKSVKMYYTEDTEHIYANM